MATITAAQVKALREASGAGMMDCKAALTETGGDMDAAVDWLRTKGLAKAAKKAGRVAAEGLVGLATAGGEGVVVELNSETDFVARNEQFQDTVEAIANLALTVGGDYDKLLATEYPGAGKPVEEHVREMVGTIGENLHLRRSAGLSVDEGVVASYVHTAVRQNLGKIAVIVALKSSGDTGKLAEFGRKLAMHIAATNPLALTSDALPADEVAREREVLSEQARESGKPENIIEKMVDGRMRKYFQDVVLLSQTFVIDGENTVEKAIEIAAKDIGAPIELTGFVRYGLGDGIEKKEEDFAAEVAATVAGA